MRGRRPGVPLRRALARCREALKIVGGSPSKNVGLGVALAALSICAAPPLPAQAQTAVAQTSATITPSLSPDRLGAKGALVVTIGYAGGEFGVPAPVRRALLRLPAGLSLEIPELRSCAVGRLWARGAGGCPAQSEIGHGHALVEARAGSQIVSEEISLWVFLGPLLSSGPTFAVLGQGRTPFDERLVLPGTVVSDNPPYGEDLVVLISPIPTLPLEPDASIVAMSLTVGVSHPRHPREANTVVVPSVCPAGGFPFAAEFTYADGSTGGALATSSCPR
jgi:hypothetical protein